MDTDICDAIENQFVIEFHYDGEVRVVEPHCYGVSSKGNEIIRGYQIGGHSSSGKMGWKLYDISKTEAIITTETKFEVRSDYKRGDKGMAEIYAEI